MSLEKNSQKPDPKELGERLREVLAFQESCGNIWKKIKISPQKGSETTPPIASYKKITSSSP